MSSRFTGYPVAEIGIGFLSYHFGSAVVNIITFINFLAGLVFFILVLKENITINFFFSNCLLNKFILFFDNIEPMDYFGPYFFFL